MLAANLIKSNIIWKIGLWAFLWQIILTALMNAIGPNLTMSETIFWSVDPGIHNWRNGIEQYYVPCLYVNVM